jgi:hypothetical protein
MQTGRNAHPLPQKIGFIERAEAVILEIRSINIAEISSSYHKNKYYSTLIALCC